MNEDFFTFSEQNMTQTIGTTVTKHSSPAIHPLNFANLYQSERESMENFIVQLKSVAQDCEYSCPLRQADLQCIQVKDQFI